MGTNSITTQSSGTILADHLNEYFDAFTEDVVPRDSDGVPADQGASFGSSILRFLNAYFYNLILGTTANGVGLSYSGDKMTLKKSGNEYMRIGNRAPQAIGGVNVGDVFTPDNEFTELITDSAFTEIARVEDVECSGRPLLAYIAEQAVGIHCSTDAPEIIKAQIQLKRDSTVIKLWEIELECEYDATGSETNGDSGVGKMFSIPANCLMAIDMPSAGTYDYVLEGKVTTADTTLFTGVSSFEHDEIMTHLTVKEL